MKAWRLTKGRLGDHPFPRLLLGLGSGLDYLEHFFFADTFDLGYGHTEAGSLFVALVLDGAADTLGSPGIISVEQERRQRIGSRLFRACRLDVLLLVGPNGLFHLDFLVVTGLVEHLGTKTRQSLRVFGHFMGFSGRAFSHTFLMVEPGD